MWFVKKMDLNFINFFLEIQTNIMEFNQTLQILIIVIDIIQITICKAIVHKLVGPKIKKVPKTFLIFVARITV
jgi:hypothetical protein